ncbi:hypothetical protein GWK47_027150 [Chionoecetes opilio]|uniref:Uncharacterized protein n=1 Tax=Chionoecetes opilio TaxID=41210 RepID=A0A8J8WKX6_CHIOP|nr:hypothetical protein GWK47_027150 [Chionoecetes opilio]
MTQNEEIYTMKQVRMVRLEDDANHNNTMEVAVCTLAKDESDNCMRPKTHVIWSESLPEGKEAFFAYYFSKNIKCTFIFRLSINHLHTLNSVEETLNHKSSCGERGWSSQGDARAGLRCDRQTAIALHADETFHHLLLFSTPEGTRWRIELSSRLPFTVPTSIQHSPLLEMVTTELKIVVAILLSPGCSTGSS